MGRFRTVTPVWIHRWLRNVAQSLKQQRRDALLFSQVIHEISWSHGTKHHRFWSKLGVYGLQASRNFQIPHICLVPSMCRPIHTKIPDRWLTAMFLFQVCELDIWTIYVFPRYVKCMDGTLEVPWYYTRSRRPFYVTSCDQHEFNSIIEYHWITDLTL